MQHNANKRKANPTHKDDKKKAATGSNKKTKGSSNKDRRRRRPQSFLDCPSVAHVVALMDETGENDTSEEVNQSLSAAPSSWVACDTTKQIFLERFQKEIVKPFLRHKEGHPPRQKNPGNYTDTAKADSLKKNDTKTIDSKSGVQPAAALIIIGTNTCLRYLNQLQRQGKEKEISTALEGEENRSNIPTLTKPNLIVLARDLYPPTLWVQIPLFAETNQIPLLILPGLASSELGQALGIKTASVLFFLPSSSSDVPSLMTDDGINVGTKMDSFVNFLTCQIPKGKAKERS